MPGNLRPGAAVIEMTKRRGCLAGLLITGLLITYTIEEVNYDFNWGVSSRALSGTGQIK